MEFINESVNRFSCQVYSLIHICLGFLPDLTRFFTEASYSHLLPIYWSSGRELTDLNKIWSPLHNDMHYYPCESGNYDKDLKAMKVIYWHTVRKHSVLMWSKTWISIGKSLELLQRDQSALTGNKSRRLFIIKYLNKIKQCRGKCYRALCCSIDLQCLKKAAFISKLAYLTAANFVWEKATLNLSFWVIWIYLNLTK